VICRQGHCSQGIGDISAKSEVCPVVKKTNCVKRVQRRYRTEFGMDAPSQPSAYALYNSVRQVVCVK
jgi:hypothetical protein